MDRKSIDTGRKGRKRLSTTEKHDKIQPDPTAKCNCGIESEIKCIFFFVIPMVGTTTYQQPKLQRWGLAILLCAPSVAVVEGLQVRKDLPPAFDTSQQMEVRHLGLCQRHHGGLSPGQRSVITVEQDSNRIHWKVAANNITDQRTGKISVATSYNVAKE